MGNKIIARKQSGWKVVSIFPDVCKTPMGSSMPPVPYPVTAKLTDSSSVSPDVNTNSHSVFLFDASILTQTLGDQAGIGKGIKSGTVGGQCLPLEHSGTVRANGKYMVRHRDKMGMNGAFSEGVLTSKSFIPEEQKILANSVRFHFTDDDKIPFAFVAYEATNKTTGEVIRGVTDKEGMTQYFYTQSPEDFEVHLEINDDLEDEEMSYE